MPRDYVEQRGDGLYVSGTRISVASVIRHFRLGASPETILQKFPAIESLGNVYGTIAWSLENQDLVDAWLVGQQQKWHAFEAAADAPPQGLPRSITPVPPVG